MYSAMRETDRNKRALTINIHGPDFLGKINIMVSDVMATSVPNQQQPCY